MTNQKNPNDYESMKKHFQAERLFVFLLAVLFCHYCHTPSVNQFCDPESKNYTNSVLLKMMTGDKSAYCGVNFVAPPANFSYPTTTTFANGSTFSLTPTVTGTSLSFTSSAYFPSGISLNSSTGVISGSYSAFAGFTGNFTITATNPGGSANSTFNLTLFGKAPVKSGQTQCWDAAGALDATCGLSTSAGQDGKLQYGTAPSLTGPSLVNASDYIATDNNTGLIWKSCNEGKSGPACATGGISSLDWPTANSNCTTLNSGAGYANRADWRLATVEESVTIVSYSGVNPATFNANFPAASGGGTWTSSTYAPASSTTAWYVSFTDGMIGATVKTNTNDVRCVSGSSLPSRSFKDNNDGTISDINTGLIWQKCSIGLTGNDCSGGTATTMNWATSLTSCNSLSLNGRTWRLPSVTELRSISDLTTGNPSVNASFFPVTSSANYWSSSTYTNLTDAWVIPFGGNTFNAMNLVKTGIANVRCVSTGP